MSDAGRLYSGTTCPKAWHTWASSLPPPPRDRPRRCGEDRILHLTAEDFEPGERRGDCIVFNECLYYVPNPLALLDKYSRLLKSRGMIVVSIYQRPGSAIKARLYRWINRRKGMPNVQCTKRVRSFMARHGLAIGDDTLVTCPKGGFCRIWVSQPSGLSEAQGRISEAAA